MKKNLKTLLISLIAILVLSCSTYKHIMYNQYDIFVSEKQIDSICRVEHIPYIGDKWYKTQFQDYESKTIMDQYLYIINYDSLQYVYTVTDLDSLYKMKKRIVKKTKK